LESKRRTASFSFVFFCILGAFSALAFILSLASLLNDQSEEIQKGVPGIDGEGPEQFARANSASCASSKIKISEFFKYFSGSGAQTANLTPTSSSLPWPQFRGAKRDNILPDYDKLALDPNLFELVWEKPLGEGHAAAAIWDGQVYLLDYIEDEKADALRAFSLLDGAEIWRRWHHLNLKRNHGFSRTVPALDENYAVALGPEGHVFCVSRLDGKLLWSKDLVSEFGTEIPGWYAGQCPIIDNGVAVIAPVGKDILMFGSDCASGEILWTTPNSRAWKMSHSSIVPMNFAKTNFYIYCASGGVCGVSADSVDRGKILWQTEDFNQKVVAPSPLPLPEGKILVTAGYGAGSILLQLNCEDGIFGVKTLERYSPSKGISSEQQTPILHDGHIYAVMPKDAGGLAGQFVCAHYSDPKKIIWSSGKNYRFGLGPYILIGDKFFVLSDNGILHCIEASAESFKPLHQAKILDGVDAWGPIAFSGGYMIVRDSRTMKCLNTDTARKSK